jgi:hypothetical protein
MKRQIYEYTLYKGVISPLRANSRTQLSFILTKVLNKWSSVTLMLNSKETTWLTLKFQHWMFDMSPNTYNCHIFFYFLFPLILVRICLRKSLVRHLTTKGKN